MEMEREKKKWYKRENIIYTFYTYYRRANRIKAKIGCPAKFVLFRRKYNSWLHDRVRARNNNYRPRWSIARFQMLNETYTHIRLNIMYINIYIHTHTHNIIIQGASEYRIIGLDKSLTVIILLDVWPHDAGGFRVRFRGLWTNDSRK